MISEVFLVHLSQPETARQLLWAAAATAAHIGPVRFEVLAIRIPPEATILPTEEVISREDCRLIRQIEVERVERLRNVYERWLPAIRDAGHHAEWLDIEGLAAREIAARGRGVDLIVIDRLPVPLDQISKDVAHAALFDCHRPVLVVPPGLRTGPDSTLGRRVAIAWKDDGRSIKAVIPALRYFPTTSDLIVLQGYRGNIAPTALPEPLEEHEIDARLIPIPIVSSPFGGTLLERALGLGADLLVMGAYTHSPLRQMLFGGVTRHVLHHAELPVLMRH
jgi:nucleotide-binding universal stress UspA family protein